MVPFLAIFARILLLRNLVQRAAGDCLWVDSSLANLSNEWRFVQRVATEVFGWVDDLTRCSLVCFGYLSTQPRLISYYKLILYKHRKTSKYGFLAIYIEYNRNLGGLLVGWTNRQKSTAYFPRVAWVKKGKLFFKHPGRHLVQPLPSSFVFRAKFRQVKNDGLSLYIQRRKCPLIWFRFRGREDFVEFLW